MNERRSWRVILAAVAIPAGLLLLAAVLRLPNLATRGTWDSDQGHDMLMLRDLVRHGIVPLLGPPTSIGDVHHGALYYYLLSPAAFLTGGDSPLAVTVLIALAGIAAVVVTWWLARSIGGPVAGLVAGLAMAVSASAVEESTFIWNPNLIALSSAIALAGAWKAWSGGRPRWWLVAGIGLAVTMQCHVLGVTMLPIIAALLIADARRRSPGVERRSVWRYGLGALAIVVISFLPLVAHELTTDFAEIHAALDYLRAGGEPPMLGPIGRFLVIGGRVVSWPLTALMTDAPFAALVATIAVVACAVWCGLFGRDREREARTLARPWPALDDARPDVHLAEPRDGHPGPAQRPLSRVRRPDGLHPHRDGDGGPVAGRGRRTRRPTSRSSRAGPGDGRPGRGGRRRHGAHRLRPGEAATRDPS